MPNEVTLQELVAQNRLLQAENERQSQEINLLKEKIDLLIRRLFGSKSEKLDAAQLELLLKDLDLGKAAASAEKAEATPNVEASKPVARASAKKQRRERWPKVPFSEFTSNRALRKLQTAHLARLDHEGGSFNPIITDVACKKCWTFMRRFSE